MGKYFGTDGFRGEANVNLQQIMHFAWDVILAGITAEITRRRS